MWRVIVQDFRLAVRGLLRRPGFSFLVAAILALGVGGTTSVYSVSDLVLFRPVPGVGAPRDRVAIVQASREDGNYTGLSYPSLLELQGGAPAIQSMAGIAPATAQIAGDGLVPSIMRADAVTEAYFELLEVPAHLGRLFSPDEFSADGDAVVVISHRFWTDEYHSVDDVIGRTLRVNGNTYSVIGVAAPGFQGDNRISPVDLWFPAPTYRQLRHFPAEYDLMGRGVRPFMSTVARLAPDATPEHAEVQLREVMERLIGAYPEDNEIHETYRPTVYPGIGNPPTSRAYLRRLVAIMFAVAGLVLLIACANVANLLVFRGAQREGAVAVRRALGASRIRIAREQLLEVMILSVVAGVLAMAVAAAFNELLWRGSGTLGIAALDGVPLNRRVLLFTLATAVAVPLAFALVPALLAGQTDVARQIQVSRPTGTARRARIRSGLTMLQLALSLSLVVGSALLLRTLDGLRRVDPGFDPTGLLLFSANPEPQGYTTEDGVRLHLELLERVREIPGVRAATLTRSAPFALGNFGGRVTRPGGDAESDRVGVQFEFIGPDFFSTLGVSMQRGRTFEPSEMTPGGVAGAETVVVNESLARQLFGSTDVVGRTLTVLGYQTSTDKRVVGVVSDIRDDPRSPAEPTLYEPFSSMAIGSYGTLLLRATGPMETVAAAIRTALTGLDPNVPLSRSTSMEETIADRSAEERMLGRLVGLLAVLAGSLAAIGLHAVVAWTVQERTREIGIRIALGARPASVAGWVVRGALSIAVVGVVTGYGASIMVTRLLESRLFGVEPFDPTTWVVAAIAMLTVAAVAAAQPALRAATVHPVEALRSN